jgi:hypothetical protein
MHDLSGVRPKAGTGGGSFSPSPSTSGVTLCFPDLRPRSTAMGRTNLLRKAGDEAGGLKQTGKWKSGKNEVKDENTN